MAQLILKANTYRLVLGNLSSVFASNCLRMASTLLVYNQTHSLFVLGIYLSLYYIVSMPLGPFAGRIADRVDKIKALCWLDFTLAILIGLVWLSSLWLGEQALSIVIFLLSVATALVSTLYLPIARTVISSIAKRKDRPKMNSQNTVALSIGEFLGPIVGTITYQKFGMTMALIVSSGGYLLSSVLKQQLKPITIEQVAFQQALARNYLELVNKYRHLLSVLIYSVAINFVFSPMLTIGYLRLINENFDNQRGLLAWTEASLVLGSVLGGVLLSLFSKKRRFAVEKLFLLLLGETFCLVAFVNDFGVYYLLGMTVLLGVLLSCYNIQMMNRFLLEVADQEQGQFMVIVQLLSTMAIPVGNFFYGSLYEHHSFGLVMLLTVLVLGIYPIYQLVRRIDVLRN